MRRKALLLALTPPTTDPGSTVQADGTPALFSILEGSGSVTTTRCSDVVKEEGGGRKRISLFKKFPRKTTNRPYTNASR